MKLAIEALNTPRPSDSYPPLWRTYENTINTAIKALEEALKQEQEYEVVDGVGRGVEIPAGWKYYYIKPKIPSQQRKPLTDEQILHIVSTHIGEISPSYPLDNSDWINFAHAIESAHGIKE